MAISKRKLAANRANAKKSTGPRTEAGRQAVAENRTTHGLCGAFKVLPIEHQSNYDSLLERFMAAEQPADDVERELVAKMVRHTWLSERALRFQEGCIIAAEPTAAEPSDDEQATGHATAMVRNEIVLFERYQAHHDRSYQRAANELAKRRKDRELRARGFESQKRAEAEAERREKAQTQRDQLHGYRVATAESKLERLVRSPKNAQPTLSCHGEKAVTTPATHQLPPSANRKTAPEMPCQAIPDCISATSTAI